MESKEIFGNVVAGNDQVDASYGADEAITVALPDDAQFPAVSEEVIMREGDECQNSKGKALLEETLVEDATSNNKKPQNGKQQRIGADGLAAEREAVYSRLDRNSDEPILAIAIDLGIPEERALKYMVEWKEKDAKNLVRHPKDAFNVVRQRLKSANENNLEASTPWRLEFADDDTSVTITLYVKKG